MAITSAAIRQLSDGNSQGTVLGRNSSDCIGFYGATTAARPVISGIVSTAAALSTVVSALAALGLVTNSTTP